MAGKRRDLSPQLLDAGPSSDSIPFIILFTRSHSTTQSSTRARIDLTPFLGEMGEPRYPMVQLFTMRLYLSARCMSSSLHQPGTLTGLEIPLSTPVRLTCPRRQSMVYFYSPYVNTETWSKACWVRNALRGADSPSTPSITVLFMSPDSGGCWDPSQEPEASCLSLAKMQQLWYNQVG